MPEETDAYPRIVELAFGFGNAGRGTDRCSLHDQQSLPRSSLNAGRTPSTVQHATWPYPRPNSSSIGSRDGGVDRQPRIPPSVYSETQPAGVFAWGNVRMTASGCSCELDAALSFRVEPNRTALPSIGSIQETFRERRLRFLAVFPCCTRQSRG